MDLLFDMGARHGTTMLLVTHEPALAERCTRLLSLADGRIESEDRG